MSRGCGPGMRGSSHGARPCQGRALKYGGPQTDFDRLQAELASGDHAEVEAEAIEVDEPVEDPYASDPYAKYYDEDDDEESEAR